MSDNRSLSQLSSRVTLSLALVLIFTGLMPLQALTIIVDFNDPGQAATADIFGNQVGTFDVTAFGFASNQFAVVIDNIFTQLLRDFYAIPTAEQDSRSPIPQGQQLDIDFEIGNIGQGPGNGDNEYFYMQVGSSLQSTSALGVSGLTAIRDSNGAGPNFGLPVGSVVGSVFTNNINSLALPGSFATALKSGDLSATTHAINGTLSHETAHTLSLIHVDSLGAITPNGLLPLLATGPTGLANEQRLFDREFAFSAISSGSQVFPVQQLINAVGLRDAPRLIPEPPGIVLVAMGIIVALALLSQKSNDFRFFRSFAQRG